MFVLILLQDFFLLLCIQERLLKNVIDNYLQAFNVIGLPKLIKTDNGPSYSSKNFTSSCKEFGIKHKTGIPYNPMGQRIVERAHHTLKKLAF
jgi:transposase InsO family protein